MKDIERELKSNEKVTVTITAATHEDMPTGDDHRSWGFAKGQLTWKVEKEGNNG